MLKPGLYEQMINQLVHQSISRLDPAFIETEPLDYGESHDILSEYLCQFISKALRAEKLPTQIDICNHIIQQLEDGKIGKDYTQACTLLPEAKRLLSIADQDNALPVHFERPDTPLDRGCILTGTRLDPSLESQIKKEIRAASRIDILCSFIKWSGIRMIEDELRDFTEKPGSLLRIITTSYMGATDLKAIDFLLDLPKTEIKVSYDIRRTRLHAKAYAFHCNTGFGTAYIGSANLTRPALTDGLEWSVKVSQYESIHLWEKVTAAFETYWNDGEFVRYTKEERQRHNEKVDPRFRKNQRNTNHNTTLKHHHQPIHHNIWL